MIAKKIKSILELGEGYDIEFKRTVPEDGIRYARTAVAFANGSGGVIIYGVDDDTHELVGVDREAMYKLADKVTSVITDSIAPMIGFDVKCQIVDDKAIIVVHVYPGMHRPYYIKADGKEDGVYIRNAAENRQADESIIKDLAFQGAGTGFDRIETIEGNIDPKKVAALCKKMYAYALSRCDTSEERKTIKKVEPKNLEAWGLITKREGKFFACNGIHLLLDNPYPNAVTQCGIFKGITRGVFLDRKEYGGPVYNQIDEAYQFVLRNIRMGVEIIGTLRRDVFELPLDGVREVIANAICHRTYLGTGRVQVALYDDRLEVTSPGRLIRGLAISDLKTGCSFPRNAALAQALAYMRSIEHWGNGIPALMKECEKMGLPPPKIEELGNAVRVTVFRRKINVVELGDEKVVPQKTLQKTLQKTPQETPQETLQKTPQKVLALIRENPSIGTQKMAELIGVERSTVARAIAKLKSSGLVRRVGSDKGGYWEVI